MAKQEAIQLEGLVTEVLPDQNFRVRLQNDHEILAYGGHPTGLPRPRGSTVDLGGPPRRCVLDAEGSES